jgi:hypothetical protein
LAGARPFDFKGRVFAFAPLPLLFSVAVASAVDFAVAVASALASAFAVASALRCHPEPIRAQRGWVRDLLLLLLFLLDVAVFRLCLGYRV